MINNSHCKELILVIQHIFDSIKASLQRLQLDYVDVLQCECSLVMLIGSICQP